MEKKKYVLEFRISKNGLMVRHLVVKAYNDNHAKNIGLKLRRKYLNEYLSSWCLLENTDYDGK